MVLLYSFISLLLISTLGLLAVPFFKNGMGILSKEFLLLSFFSVLFTMSFYHFFGQTKALEQWLGYGKEHYRLMVEVERLGGINGIIQKLKKRLEEHPEDAKGWRILGKLYQANHEEASAMDAFAHANDLTIYKK